MCGWNDYIELFKSLSKKISEESPDTFFTAESEYVNISAGYTYYYSAIYDKGGLKIFDSAMCCEFCGHPIFGEDAFFMRNEDEGVIALCSEDCKTRFLDEWDEENGEWEDASREDYEEENGI